MQSRSWEKTRGRRTRRDSLPLVRPQRLTIKSWLLNANMKRAKKLSKLTSSAFRNSSRKRTRTLNITIRVCHVRWKPRKVRVPKRRSQTLSRSWPLDWTLRLTKILRRSACLISMWETRRSYQRPSKRLWKPQALTISMRSLHRSSRLKNKTFSSSTTWTNWTKRMTSLRNLLPTTTSRSPFTRSYPFSIRTISPQKLLRWEAITKTSANASFPTPPRSMTKNQSSTNCSYYART